VLASILGGMYDFERERSAAESAKRQGISGFNLAGFGTGESRQERAVLMQAAIAQLPSTLPRFLLAGAGDSLRRCCMTGCTLLGVMG
jgi:tRNA-guanine family transglycosylase